MKTFGSRAEVWHGNAKKTSGGLTKKDLIRSRLGQLRNHQKQKNQSKQKNHERDRSLRKDWIISRLLLLV